MSGGSSNSRSMVRLPASIASRSCWVWASVSAPYRPAELVAERLEPGRGGVGGVGVLDEGQLAPQRLLVLAGPTVDLHRQAEEPHAHPARAGRRVTRPPPGRSRTTRPCRAPVGRVPQRTARSSRMRRPRPVLAVVECGWRTGGVGSSSLHLDREQVGGAPHRDRGRRAGVQHGVGDHLGDAEQQLAAAGLVPEAARPSPRRASPRRGGVARQLQRERLLQPALPSSCEAASLRCATQSASTAVRTRGLSGSDRRGGTRIRHDGGVSVQAVTTTGIYCVPSCSARPHPGNVVPLRLTGGGRGGRVPRVPAVPAVPQRARRR